MHAVTPPKRGVFPPNVSAESLRPRPRSPYQARRLTPRPSILCLCGSLWPVPYSMYAASPPPSRRWKSASALSARRLYRGQHHGHRCRCIGIVTIYIEGREREGGQRPCVRRPSYTSGERNVFRILCSPCSYCYSDPWYNSFGSRCSRLLVGRVWRAACGLHPCARLVYIVIVILFPTVASPPLPTL